MALGEPSIKKKTGKFGKNYQLGLTPPPSDNSELFEFQNFLKTSDPPPPTVGYQVLYVTLNLKIHFPIYQLSIHLFDAG